MTTITVGCSANATLFDRAIRYAEGRLDGDAAAPTPLASHVWLEYAIPGLPALGLEAIPSKGVHAFSPAIKAGQVVRRYLAPVDSYHAEAIWSAAYSDLCKPYSFGGIARVAFYLLTRQDERFFCDPKAFFCSQFVCTALRAGIVALPEMDADDVTPARMEQWCVQQKWSAIP